MTPTNPKSFPQPLPENIRENYFCPERFSEDDLDRITRILTNGTLFHGRQFFGEISPLVESLLERGGYEQEMIINDRYTNAGKKIYVKEEKGVVKLFTDREVNPSLGWRLPEPRRTLEERNKYWTDPEERQKYQRLEFYQVTDKDYLINLLRESLIGTNLSEQGERANEKEKRKVSNRIADVRLKIAAVTGRYPITKSENLLSVAYDVLKGVDLLRNRREPDSYLRLEARTKARLELSKLVHVKGPDALIYALS